MKNKQLPLLLCVALTLSACAGSSSRSSGSETGYTCLVSRGDRWCNVSGMHQPIGTACSCECGSGTERGKVIPYRETDGKALPCPRR